jgi:hypothetical protein
VGGAAVDVHAARHASAATQPHSLGSAARVCRARTRTRRVAQMIRAKIDAGSSPTTDCFARTRPWSV